MNEPTLNTCVENWGVEKNLQWREKPIKNATGTSDNT
jgi:hypothetical protein